MNIVDIAIKSVVVTAIGLGLFAFLRRGSAATRHYLLALTLFSLCALPFLTPVLPHWPVPFIHVQAPKANLPASTPDSASLTTPVTSTVSSLPPVTGIATPHAMDTDTAVLVLWASIAALLGLRVMTRLSRLRKLERSLPMCAQPELQSLVAEYCRRHRRHFLLLEGESNEPPMTWGHGRPVLLLPSSAREWPADRLRSVMLHELAHVERGDWIVSLVSELICATFWFNPLVWVLRKRLEIESEQAADDWVVSMGVPRTDYATHLVELLRDLNRFPKAADAAVAMTRPSRLDARVKAILLERGPARQVQGSASIGLIALVALTVGAVGAAGPTIVQASAPSNTKVAEDPDQNLLAQVDIVPALVEPPVSVHRSQPATSGGAGGRDISALNLTHAGHTIHLGSGDEVLSHTDQVSKITKKRVPATPASNTRAAGTASAGRDASITSTGWDDIASSSEAGDIGDDFGKEFEAKMNRATAELNKSLEKIEKQATVAGVKSVGTTLNSLCNIDLPGIISGAMKAANTGLSTSNLTPKQQEEIRKQIRDSLRQAMDSVPPSLRKPHT